MPIVDIEILNDKYIEEKFDRLFTLRDNIAKYLEEARVNKIIGSSLDSKVIIKAKDDTYEFILDNIKLLEEILIVSQIELVKDGVVDLEIKITRAEGQKCPRCWKYEEAILDENKLCHRCHSVLEMLQSSR